MSTNPDIVDADVRRALRAQDVDRMRGLIQGTQLLNDVVLISNGLQAGYESLRQADGTWVEVPIGRERVASLKAAADIKLKLLNKVVPDLATVTLKNEEEGPLRIVITEEERGL